MTDTELSYLLALSNIDGIGSIRIKALLDHLEKPSLIWKSSQQDLRQILGPKISESFITQRKTLDPDRLLEQLHKTDVKTMTLWDKEYPRMLREIPDPPALLYYRGDFEPADNKAIGIVGTRRMTPYGKQVTEFFTKTLVEHGFTIVSGLAHGVDGCAHAAALKNGGRTIAVLGGGLNRMYPSVHIPLAKKIEEHGVVVSEYPPDFAPHPGTFPGRNRIISGLSHGVLITEAAEDSGSLITGTLALEQSREVFAVPGPIFSKQSEGTALLIKQGAKLTSKFEDILDELGFAVAAPAKQAYEPKNELEQTLLESLTDSKHIDDLIRELNTNPSEVSACLSLLEIHGAVTNLGSGTYRRSH